MSRDPVSPLPASRADIDAPDLPLAELFRAWPQAARAFWARRMACPGCPIAPFHAVSDACAEYALDEAVFRAEIRAEIRAGIHAEIRAAQEGGAEASATPPPRSAAPGDEGPSR